MISLSVGKRYVMRNGEVTGVMSYLEESPLPFFDNVHAWDEYGNYDLHAKDDKDIISEFPEPKATEVRRDWADEMDRTWEKGRV